MNYPAYDRFLFHRNGNAYRRDADAKPRVLLLGSVTDPDGDFAGVIVHFAGDEFTREIPRHAINADLVNDLEPAQAFSLGRFVEGGELELDQTQTSRYVEPASAKSGAGFSSSNDLRRTSATTGAFLLPVNGDVRGTPKGVPVPLDPGLLTRVRHRPTISSVDGDFIDLRSHIVKKTLSLPRRAKAKAHRRMAMAALRADSSRSVRQARFDHHMTIARNIERGQS